MEEPKLTVIGVYRPQISPETWQEQWDVSADDIATQKHFDGLVLIEACVAGLTEPFDLGKLGQVHFDVAGAPEHMQVGYDEGLLDPNGTEILARNMDCLQNTTAPQRFAVYLHFYDPTRPLLWQLGEVECPPISEMPARLMDLMPYRAV